MTTSLKKKIRDQIGKKKRINLNDKITNLVLFFHTFK